MYKYGKTSKNILRSSSVDSDIDSFNNFIDKAFYL